MKNLLTTIFLMLGLAIASATTIYNGESIICYLEKVKNPTSDTPTKPHRSLTNLSYCEINTELNKMTISVDDEIEMVTMSDVQGTIIFEDMTHGTNGVYLIPDLLQGTYTIEITTTEYIYYGEITL